MDPLATFTVETFRDRVGETFDATDAETSLRLTSVLDEGAGAGLRAGGAFTLTFEADGEQPLPQAIHQLEHEELGSFGLFMHPVARTSTGFAYQAVFN